jgi:hypothetical protein
VRTMRAWTCRPSRTASRSASPAGASPGPAVSLGPRGERQDPSGVPREKLRPVTPSDPARRRDPNSGHWTIEQPAGRNSYLRTQNFRKGAPRLRRPRIRSPSAGVEPGFATRSGSSRWHRFPDGRGRLGRMESRRALAVGYVDHTVGSVFVRSRPSCAGARWSWHSQRIKVLDSGRDGKVVTHVQKMGCELEPALARRSRARCQVRSAWCARVVVACPALPDRNLRASPLIVRKTTNRPSLAAS